LSRDPESDKTIFITGAASGIGRETALLFGERGFKVGLFDLNQKGLEEVAAQVGAGRAVTGVLDVRDFAAYQQAVADFAAFSGGRMDVLFNCAGVMRMGPFADTSIEDHRLTLEINVIGVLHGIYASLGLLKATPGAHILSMGSASGIYGVPDLAIYSASKFFVRGLTEGLNLEFEKLGITVTDIMPLYVNTPMVQTQSYHAGSLKTFGARLTPRQIAEIAWKAAHGKKVHWVPGLLLKSLNYLGGAVPFITKPTMKLIDRRK
jgi:NAD(P)-dependent dehydrogenase (short-subunit alcohol dehydrogenase family)